jgi:hypothetical protein
MTTHYAGGCQHVHVTATAEPIDNHECHCNVCKSVTGQQTTHVAFFNHGDIQVDHPEKIKRVPFNKPRTRTARWKSASASRLRRGADAGRQAGRIRVAVPNIMGYDDAKFPKATYHAFWDETKGYPAPTDGRPGLRRLQPSFVWPQPCVGRGSRPTPQRLTPP